MNFKDWAGTSLEYLVTPQSGKLASTNKFFSIGLPWTLKQNPGSSRGHEVVTPSWETPGFTDFTHRSSNWEDIGHHHLQFLGKVHCLLGRGRSLRCAYACLKEDGSMERNNRFQSFSMLLGTTMLLKHPSIKSKGTSISLLRTPNVHGFSWTSITCDYFSKDSMLKYQRKARTSWHLDINTLNKFRSSMYDFFSC